MNRQHLSNMAETAGRFIQVDSGEFSASDTEPSASNSVGLALEELRKFGRLNTLKASALSAEDVREVCGRIRQDLLAEIKAGNTVFEEDELEVAFELELQKYGLHKAYANVLDRAAPPRTIADVPTNTNGNGKGEIDKSAIGFSKMEIKRIPKSARETINQRFRQMTIQGRARRKAQEISESDVICISDIVRILLTYQDSFGQQFHDRLGLSDKMIWALLHEHDICVLRSDEREALVLLAEEANGLDALKEKLGDDVVELQIQSLRHMVLYRRLMRMEHTSDAQQQLQKVMDALELSAKEYASAEHVAFAGMSNHDIAPDLFPYGEDDSLLEFIAELQAYDKKGPTSLVIGSEGEDVAELYPKEFECHTIVSATAQGILDWYPKSADIEHYPPSRGMPGSDAKLEDLAQRVRLGLPLWHPEDRQSYESRGDVCRNEMPRISLSRYEEEEEGEGEEGGEKEDEVAGEGE